MADPLGERQGQILRAIVREFIRSGEPVGSKHLVERTRLDVSAATVRNEMARLEELGYLTHPHTSAGRVPTDTGYRFVVDGIKRPRGLTQAQLRALEAELGTDDGSIEELLRRASEVVSRFTRHASAMLAFRARSNTLRRVELLRVATGRAAIVAIAENGRIEQHTAHVDETLTDEDLRVLGERLSAVHHGRVLETVIDELRTLASTAVERERAAVSAVVDTVQGLLDAERHVVIGGVANLANEEDFERETLHRLYEALEQQTAVMELLANTLEDVVTVRIGGELGDESFQHVSVVSAPFGPTGSARGSVGIIGPMRMDYERVIATATAVARLIEGTLGTPDQP
jgi:heat-inducible transcriptional repressor